MAIPYRYFGITYRSNFKGQKSKIILCPWRLDRQVVSKLRWRMATIRCIISQKSADLICFTAEGWYHIYSSNLCIIKLQEYILGIFLKYKPNRMHDVKITLFFNVAYIYYLFTILKERAELYPYSLSVPSTWSVTGWRSFLTTFSGSEFIPSYGRKTIAWMWKES